MTHPIDVQLRMLLTKRQEALDALQADDPALVRSTLNAMGAYIDEARAQVARSEVPAGARQWRPDPAGGVA